MNLKQIATALVDGCNSGQEEENLGKLYAEDAVSVEAVGQGGQSPETRGLEGIRGKHAWWAQAFETHATQAKGPYFHGDDRFTVIFTADATDRSTGARFTMEEVAVYHVKGGKIVREEFFYASEG
jgi:ketosteroid isomerase-like protein